MSSTTGETMSLAERVNRGWSAHGDDPEGVASTLPALIADADAGHAPRIAGLVVHVLGEHLGRYEEALALLGDGLGDLAGLAPVVRSRLALTLARDADEAVLAMVPGEPGQKAGGETLVLAAAAGLRAARGDVVSAGRWLARAGALSFKLPPDDPGVRAVAVHANNLACQLETGPRGGEEDRVLRSTAQLAFACWERAGTWMNVERAEYRLAKTHLALGEPVAAVTHALACLEICRNHQAEPGEWLYAHEVLAEALKAAGDAGGLAAQLEEITALGELDPQIAQAARGMVERLS